MVRGRVAHPVQGDGGVARVVVRLVARVQHPVLLGARFVGNALSPAKVVSVRVVDERAKTARVVVPDFQLSLAIGKEGQNARLAARLTGWRIDIRSDAAPADHPGGPEGDQSHAGPPRPAATTGSAE